MLECEHVDARSTPARRGVGAGPTTAGDRVVPHPTLGQRGLAASQDHELAMRIRAGDRLALGELYDRHASAALTTALRVATDRGDAEDVVHEAFLTVWMKIQLFDVRRGSLRSWLLAIVRHRAIDQARAKRPTVNLAEEGKSPGLDTSTDATWEQVLARRTLEDLQAAMETLPADQRRALALAYFGGRTYREVAAITQVAAGTANGRLRAALCGMRRALAATSVVARENAGWPPASFPPSELGRQDAAGSEPPLSATGPQTA